MVYKLEINTRKKLIIASIFLLAIAYIGFAELRAIQKTQLLDGDGMFRSLFSVMVKNIFTEFFKGRIASIDDLKNIIHFYHSHYQVGLEALFTWPPLQTFIIFVILLFFKISPLVLGQVNIIFLGLLIFLLYRLTHYLYKDHMIAIYAITFIMLHPFIFEMSVSLERITGEAFFMIAMLDNLVRFIDKHKEHYALNGFLFFALGCLYRIEAFSLLIIPLVLGILYGAREKGIRQICSIIWGSHKKYIALLITLYLFLFCYAVIQIPLTHKNVGTIITKGLKYKDWSNDQKNPPGFLTASDYFMYNREYFENEFNQDGWAWEKNNNYEKYKGLLLVKNRFSIPIYKKAVFILSSLFYEIILIPSFIMFIVFGYSNFDYKRMLLIISFFLYFALYSFTGTVPFYAMTMLPLIAIFSADGLHQFIIRIKPIIWQRIVVILFVFTGILQFVWGYTFGELRYSSTRYVSPKSIIKTILDDEGSSDVKFTILCNFQTALPLSMELIKDEKNKNIYFRQLYKHQLNYLQDWITEGGYILKSKFLGETHYPEIRYFVVMSLSEYKFWSSVFKENPFSLYKILSNGENSAYIFKRKKLIY